MNKKLILLGLGVGGLLYLSGKEKPKSSKIKVNYDEKLLESQGFIFTCDDADYIFIIKDKYKLKGFMKNTLGNIFGEEKFSNVNEYLDLPIVFEEFIVYITPKCAELFKKGEYTKKQAIGFSRLIQMFSYFIIEMLYGEAIAIKIFQNPELSLPDAESELKYQEAFSYYEKFIKPSLIEYNSAHNITEEDLKNPSDMIII